MTPVMLCIISGICGALLGIFALGIVSASKNKEPRNKVRFFVDKDNMELSLQMTYRNYTSFICCGDLFRHYGLKKDDFADMKEGEVREVFLDREYQA